MKNLKKTTIVAMATIAGATIAQESKAMKAAMQDMQSEYGKNAIHVEYTWDPFDGMLA